MKKIIDIAKSEIGIIEEPINKVKYNTWYYGKEVSGDDYPWCGAFVSWCYNEAEIPLDNIDSVKGFVSCPNALNHFKTSGEIVKKENVKEGDIVLFDWNGDGYCEHTGIFSKDLGNGMFESIEGNTSLANQSNGGEVMIRQRRYGAVKAFVHPKILDK